MDVSGAGMWQGVHAVRTLEGTHDYAHRTATICLPHSRFVSVSVVMVTVDYDDMKHIKWLRLFNAIHAASCWQS